MRRALAVAGVLLISARAARAAVDCSKPENARSVVCRWAPSIGAGLVVRFIPLPSTIDVCARRGKTCHEEGTFQAQGELGMQQAMTVVINATAIGIGPLRFGLEMGVGGSQGGVNGRYGDKQIRSGGFVFAAGAFTGGFALAFGRLHLRLEGLAGISSLSGDTGLKNDAGKSLQLNFTYAQLEGRSTVLWHATPWVSLGVMGGYGLGDVWHAGAIVRFSLTPWDGQPPLN